VTWTNNDSATHTITGDGGLDSGDVATGGTYSKTFDKAGTYKYHCSIHPTMTGEVVVQ
jgi:plastocyanin